MLKKTNIVLVCSPYYRDITNNLINGAIDVLTSKSVQYEIFNVPGALEIAPAIKLIYDKNKTFYDGFIALGCVIRGQTYHFEIVSNESARALTQLSTNFSLPISNGILTVENKDQAIERSDPSKLNKGAGAALACLSLIEIKNSVSKYVN